MSRVVPSSSSRGQHVGLQQLAALTTAAHAFLGPSKRYKFIVDDGGRDSALVCSGFRLLENLDLTCSVGQLLNEAVQAHQRAFRSGTGSLLFLAGAWGKAALECLRQGIAVPHILAGMSEGLDVCLQVCRERALSLEDLLKAGQRDSPQPRPRLLSATSRKIKLTHSRHFGSVETQNSALQQKCLQDADLSYVATLVSHGCNDAMSLVLEAGRIQSAMSGKCDTFHSFDIDKVATCVLPGPSEEHSCALPGYVVHLTDERAFLIERLAGRLQIVLLNGDLSESYRHVGFCNPPGLRYVSDALDVHRVGGEEEWMDGVLGTLAKLGVGVVFVTGAACRKLTDRCWRCDILVVERVRPAVLRDFAGATGAVPVAYASQLSKRCVGSGVRVRPWRRCGASPRAESLAVTVTAERAALVTVVIASPVRSKLQALEDRFWGCAHRLHHALEDGKLLPGGGVVELQCVRQLRERMKGPAEQTKCGRPKGPYVAIVLQGMINGLMDYVSTVMCNSGLFSSKADAWAAINNQLKETDVTSVGAGVAGLDLSDQAECESAAGETGRAYDNTSVKVEAWRRALDLVFLVLQTDAEIITGIDIEDRKWQHDGLMFL
ncbi:Bardet-Biedl syndrome 12 protein homolog [Denticeps clupeoides]|uniref:Bardet-Biedl syndrome 12 protein homolog n=1 Tax=Denticeps clupeoides TaxID=299321 RepID=UPI0010A4262B|nr:Bardet-Biedl syndrome 12 protein homolog [Denticeps clupeoides]